MYIRLKKKIAELEAQPVVDTKAVDFLKRKLLLLVLLDQEIERFTHAEYKRLKKIKLLPSQAGKAMKKNRRHLIDKWDETIKELRDRA